MAAAPDGSIFLAGSFDGEICIETQSFSALQETDGFLAKFDEEGNLLWFKHFQCQGEASLSSILIDEQGYLYVRGAYECAVVFDTLMHPTKPIQTTPLSSQLEPLPLFQG